AWVVEDWLRGWAGRESERGPGRLVETAGAGRFVGYVGLGAREAGRVELVYGIAPGWRDRGLATRATRLVTRWLIDERDMTAVELRIGIANGASQRVAEK